MFGIEVVAINSYWLGLSERWDRKNGGGWMNKKSLNNGSNYQSYLYFIDTLKGIGSVLYIN